MTGPVPIASLFANVIARAERMAGFQALLANCPTPGDRKGLILDARHYGAIDDADTELLISALQLEAE